MTSHGNIHSLPPPILLDAIQVYPRVSLPMSGQERWHHLPSDLGWLFFLERRGVRVSPGGYLDLGQEKSLRTNAVRSFRLTEKLADPPGVHEDDLNQFTTSELERLGQVAKVRGVSPDLLLWDLYLRHLVHFYSWVRESLCGWQLTSAPGFQRFEVYREYGLETNLDELAKKIPRWFGKIVGARRKKYDIEDDHATGSRRCIEYIWRRKTTIYPEGMNEREVDIEIKAYNKLERLRVEVVFLRVAPPKVRDAYNLNVELSRGLNQLSLYAKAMTVEATRILDAIHAKLPEASREPKVDLGELVRAMEDVYGVKQSLGRKGWCKMIEAFRQGLTFDPSSLPASERLPLETLKRLRHPERGILRSIPTLDGKVRKGTSYELHEDWPGRARLQANHLLEQDRLNPIERRRAEDMLAAIRGYANSLKKIGVPDLDLPQDIRYFTDLKNGITTTIFIDKKANGATAPSTGDVA